MAGKNMNYFLMDSTPNGRIKCTLANWTGVAYKIPRVKLVDCKSIDYLKQSGVYFLFSKSDGDKPLVYRAFNTSLWGLVLKGSHSSVNLCWYYFFF